MVWGVVAGAAIGGLMSYFGSKDQADAIGDSAQQSSNVQLRMYEQSREDMAPWREAGLSALNEQLRLLGLSPVAQASSGLSASSPQAVQDLVSLEEWRAQEPERPQNPGRHGSNLLGYRIQHDAWMANRPSIVDAEGNVRISPDVGEDLPPQEEYSVSDTLRNLPGYQFALDEGLKAVDRRASAGGYLGGGAHLKELQRYGMGYADQNFDKYFNRLAALSGSGQVATTDLASMGQGVAGAMGNNFNLAGYAQGNHAINTANIGTNMVNNLTDYYAYKNFNSDPYGNREFGYEFSGDPFA